MSVFVCRLQYTWQCKTNVISLLEATKHLSKCGVYALIQFSIIASHTLSLFLRREKDHVALCLICMVICLSYSGMIRVEKAITCVGT